jgi:glutamate-5-semialdehyde dehydrogenase
MSTAERNIPLSLLEQMLEVGRAARAAATQLAQVPAGVKRAALESAARELRAARAAVLRANADDVAEAKARGLSNAMIDRLALDDKRLEATAVGLETVAALEDPVGQVIAAWERPNGLKISRVRVPLGVIGIIYESRPNVTADAAALCLKSGNAAILRGGSESARSSAAIHACLRRALAQHGLPETAVQMVPTQDRDAVGIMLRDMAAYIDVIVPRGGKGLGARVQQDARAQDRREREAAPHGRVRRDGDGADRPRVRSHASRANRRRPAGQGLRGARRRADAGERPAREGGGRQRLGPGIPRCDRRDPRGRWAR